MIGNLASRSDWKSEGGEGPKDEVIGSNLVF